MKTTTDALVEAREAIAESSNDAGAVACATAALALARTEQAEPEPAQVCCGEYRTCNKACTPRGLWLAFHPAPVPQPVQVVPDGWVCVPREPTQEMIEAALDSMDGSNAPEDDAALKGTL